jgi:hypothetical protein
MVSLPAFGRDLVGLLAQIEPGGIDQDLGRTEGFGGSGRDRGDVGVPCAKIGDQAGGLTIRFGTPLVQRFGAPGKTDDAGAGLGKEGRRCPAKPRARTGHKRDPALYGRTKPHFPCQIS